MSTLEFKKYNRKYIIVQSFDDTKLPADDEVLGEGVVIVYTPTGNMEEAERVKIGDGATTFANLSWLYDTTSGDAKASDIRSGKKAWVDGIEVTGNLGSAIFMNNAPTISMLQAGMPTINIPVKVLQPGIVDGDAEHTASWILTSVEPNLKAENIPEGLSLFQIAGSLGWGDRKVY